QGVLAATGTQKKNVHEKVVPDCGERHLDAAARRSRWCIIAGADHIAEMIVAESAAQQRTGVNVAEYTVSELANAIKRALEDGFGYVRLRGEVTGFRGVHASGHCYFALKDDKAKIEAVIWRTTWQRLKVK